MAKDFFHEAVKSALIDDGWTITHDPYKFEEKVDMGRGLQIDLGAERFIGAAKGNDKIAIEIKSFLGLSLSYQFHQAVGQYLNYRAGLMLQEPDRIVFLAIPKESYLEIEETPMFKLSCEINKINIIVYDLKNDKILSWINN